MVTFFTIFLVLVVFNVGLLIFSATNASQKVSKLAKSISEQSAAKIYPLELGSTKLKKAI